MKRAFTRNEDEEVLINVVIVVFVLFIIFVSIDSGTVSAPVSF